MTNDTKPPTPVERVTRCLGMGCLTPMERIVLALIASFDGDRGAFPRVRTLAEGAAVSDRRVRKITASLREHGVLSTVKTQRTNIYMVDYAHVCPEQFGPVCPEQIGPFCPEHLGPVCPEQLVPVTV